MEREYEKRLGTILVVISLAILLFAFYQAYQYTQNPPSGTYNILTLKGGGGGGSANGTFNGMFVATFSFLLIQCLVGAFILKAGWNLVTPKAETIQVRVKPRSLLVEPAGYSVPPTGASQSPPMAATTPSVPSAVGSPAETTAGTPPPQS